MPASRGAIRLSDTLTARKTLTAPNDMDAKLEEYEWLDPWVAVNDSDGGLTTELNDEVSEGHPLFGVAAIAIGENSATYDDFLFRVELPQHQFAFVHLTWKKEPSPEFPFTYLYRDWEHFCEECMRPNHAEHRGK